VNVLRDTHRALVHGGLLLDFHPVAPPWPRVVASGETLGELRLESFLDDLRATEGGMAETVRLGLFKRVAARTHEIAEHYDDADELLETWSDEEEQWMSAELERRLRKTAAPVDVVERLVFHLYQRLESGSASPTRRRRGRSRAGATHPLAP
jgi:hypothetical protein